MSLFAGVCETNITPPPGVWMGGYAGRPTGAVGVHDELYGHALALDNGHQRVVLVAADLIALDFETALRVREQIARQTGTTPSAVLLHCTHTHGGPYTGIFRCMGPRDAAYLDVLERKLVGVALQAANRLQPAHLLYGEAPAQIGVNRRKSGPEGRITLGVDYAGPVAPQVQTLCVNGADGHAFALLFCHACHPTTVGNENLHFTADWPGAAVAHLKTRFRAESPDSGIRPDALPIFLQGCCGDINPYPRGTWEDVAAHGRAIADAAHTARWNAHGRLDDHLEAEEETLELPLLPPPEPAECDRLIAEWSARLEQDRAAGARYDRILLDEGDLAWATESRAIPPAGIPAVQPFTIQRLTLGGVHLLGFPAEMFVQYQRDFAAQSREPVLALGYTNGCWNYVPTAAEYTRGGYEVEEAFKYYGLRMFAPDCEPLLRRSVYRLLRIEDPDLTPYPLQHGSAR
jgi:hypothetical protein